jgi:hypothetical protein
VNTRPEPAAGGWADFWFAPADPAGLRGLRLLAGLLFLAWLLAFAGHQEALFGLGGWFDRQAYQDAARQQGGPPVPLGWSLLYLCGDSGVLVRAAWWLALAALALFTLGLWTRVTAVLAWLVVASFIANPALSFDADYLLVILAFYLMVGHLLQGQWDGPGSLAFRLLGPGRAEDRTRPSRAANLTVRLLQVHFALVVVVGALHKLQFGDWWAGVAFWYPLHPPFRVTPEGLRAVSAHATAYLFVLSLAQYVLLAWQLAFPLFAWRKRWRPVLLGGAVVGWLGSAFLFRQPLFGPVLLLACLAYLTPPEWQRLLSWPARALGFLRGLRAPRPAAEPSAVSLAGRVLAGAQGRARVLLWFSLGLALAGAGCAPVEEVPPEAPAPPPAPDRSNERVPVAPPGVNAESPLQRRIDAALEQVRQRDVLTTHGFWTVFHAILGLGPEVTLLDPETKRRVNALDHICGGGEVRGLQFLPTPFGLDVRTGPQFVGQGHQDQFVAEMAQWGMPADRRFVVNGREFTFADFVRHTQARARVKANQELSWAVLVIGQYRGTDLAWTNAEGEPLRFGDVVRYELDQPIDGAACGGTHRLFGLTWVYHLRLAKGGRKEGVWRDVADKIDLYKRRARQYQNPGGAFSTRYLAGPGNSRDVQVRIGTTGHVLEWLALALSDAELRQPWVQEAANALSLMILDSQDLSVEGGALYHAAHGLHLYRARVFGPVKGHAAPLIPLPPAAGKGRPGA